MGVEFNNNFVHDFTTTIRQIDEKTSKRGEQLMKKAGAKVQRYAKMMAPEDTTSLVRSIRMKNIRGQFGQRGRGVMIFIDPNQRVTRRAGRTYRATGRETFVRDYAGRMESGEPPYNLGRRSEEKNRGRTRFTVGPGFMSKAMDMVQETDLKVIIDEMRKTIRRTARKRASRARRRRKT